MSYFSRIHERILRKFVSCEVEFVLIGGHAAIFHGVRRTTSDMDFLVRPTLANGKRVLKAFAELGLDIADLNADDFTHEHFFSFGTEPNCVDVMTFSRGVPLEVVFENAALRRIDNLVVRIIDIRDLLKNKESLNRPDERGLVDQQDILALRRILREK